MGKSCVELIGFIYSLKLFQKQINCRKRFCYKKCFHYIDITLFKPILCMWSSGPTVRALSVIWTWIQFDIGSE